jgi:hypothetical protein
MQCSPATFDEPFLSFLRRTVTCAHRNFPLVYPSHLATGWTVQGSNPGEGEILRTRPDRPSGLPSLPYNGHPVSFQGVKRPGRGVNHPLLFLWRYLHMSNYFSFHEEGVYTTDVDFVISSSDCSRVFTNTSEYEYIVLRSINSNSISCKQPVSTVYLAIISPCTVQ